MIELWQVIVLGLIFIFMFIRWKHKKLLGCGSLKEKESRMTPNSVPSKAQELVKATNWESITEEDYVYARRAGVKPRLMYWDKDGNVYHFIGCGSLKEKRNPLPKVDFCSFKGARARRYE